MSFSELDDMNIYDILGLKDIKERPDILSEIKFDVTPQAMMQPRFQSRPEDLAKLQEISGYLFYIESATEPPALMLLRIGRSDITTTVGKIDEIPVEMLRRAIDQPALPPDHGMYAISEEIREWLKKELGL
ncbi:MAG: hypothetical protein FIA94_11495 [Nitrospirae bacterium]|nr:hypothetical protein [Nitrospirota bacterium]